MTAILEEKSPQSGVTTCCMLAIADDGSAQQPCIRNGQLGSCTVALCRLGVYLIRRNTQASAPARSSGSALHGSDLGCFVGVEQAPSCKGFPL